MSDTQYADPIGPLPDGSTGVADIFGGSSGFSNVTGTNLDVGGASAVAPIDLSTNPDFGALSGSGVIPGVGYDGTQGAPPSKPTVPTDSPSWISQALSSLGKTTSAVTSWITSPFQTAIDNRAGTPAVASPGAQSPVQSRLASLFGTGSPASAGGSPLMGGAAGSNLLLYGGLAFLLIALVKRR